jgi:hypothetical protein
MTKAEIDDMPDAYCAPHLLSPVPPAQGVLHDGPIAPPSAPHKVQCLNLQCH